MSAGRRNVIVALTVIGAMIALGWMIVKFGGTLGGLFAGGDTRVSLILPRVDGLSEGARVIYRGRGVGRVESIAQTNSRTSFDIGLVLSNDNLPANVVGVVKSANPISGNALVELELQGEEALGRLGEDADVIIGRSMAGSLVPEELPKLAQELQLLVADMRQQNLVGTIGVQAAKLGELSDSINDIAGDEAIRGDIRASISTGRTAVEEAALAAETYRKLGERFTGLQDDAESLLIDLSATADATRKTAEQAEADLADVSRQLQARLEQLDTMLATGNKLLNRVESGQGTIGLLLNDPRVYEALYDDLLIVEDLLLTAQRLLEQFEEEGIKISIF
jgi:phospholipid/cholesterol/gamma-HCH transport system substrate-binding protein